MRPAGANAAADERIAAKTTEANIVKYFSFYCCNDHYSISYWEMLQNCYQNAAVISVSVEKETLNKSLNVNRGFPSTLQM
jgi:hypothetical protein